MKYHSEMIRNDIDFENIMIVSSSLNLYSIFQIRESQKCMDPVLDIQMFGGCSGAGGAGGRNVLGHHWDDPFPACHGGLCGFLPQKTMAVSYQNEVLIVGRNAEKTRFSDKRRWGLF